MTMSEVGTYAAAIFLLIGAAFAVVGAIGLLKLNDPMKRLHAPTKVGTMGIGSLLLGSVVISFVRGGSSIHELLIMAFLFVTAPISANFISKVIIHLRGCDETPELDNEQTWSTLVQREEDLVAQDKTQQS